MNDRTERASCHFESCTPSMVERVVMAAVDQLCALVDVDIALLDALECPLSEGVSALAPFEIRRVDVEVRGRQLTISVTLASDVPEPQSAFGDAFDIIMSFFEVRAPGSRRELLLIGSLA